MRWNWSWWIWPIARVTREFGGEREKCFFSFWMQAECASFCLCSLFILLVYLLIYWLFQQKTLQTNWVSLQHTRGGAGELICLLQSDACESHTFFFFWKLFFILFFLYIFRLEYWASLTESLFWVYLLTLCLLQLAWVPEWTHQHRLMLVKKTHLFMFMKPSSYLSTDPLFRCWLLLVGLMVGHLEHVKGKLEAKMS